MWAVAVTVRATMTLGVLTVERSIRLSCAEDWARDPKIDRLLLMKARKAARLPGFTASDVPDIKQDLWLHLLRRLSCYDHARSSPETFASRVSDNCIASMARAQQALKRAGAVTAASIDAPGPNEERGGSGSQVIDEASRQRHLNIHHSDDVDRTDLRLDVREVIDGTSAGLQKLAALLSHVPQFAAGEILGLSRRRTATLVAKLRELFESADLGPDVQNIVSRSM
jgi:DNA-directed RNA polymerase specialized sigma24 family protein